MSGDTRDRVEAVLVAAGYAVYDYAERSADTGDCSGGEHDAYGLSDGPDGSVTVNAMLGFGSLDAADRTAFESAAAARGIVLDPDGEHDDERYDDWSYGMPPYVWPNEGRDEAYDAADAEAVGVARSALVAAGLSAVPAGEGGSLSVSDGVGGLG